jgi:DNA-binding transcriptional LysR family regulator
VSLSAYHLFSTIAEYGNMTKAAEALHITPSAASHAISALERSFGFPLLYRDRNGATLTTDGKLLLPQIRSILSQEKNLQEYVSQIKGLEKGCVSVGVFDSVCRNWIPRILHTFYNKYPHIEVRVYQEGYRAIENMLLEGTLDIGFLSLPTSSERFSTITLAHDRLLCVTPPDYVPPNKTYVTLQDLEEMTLILPQRGYDHTTRTFLAENQLQQDERYFITLDNSVIALVENGLGCSIMPELVLQNCAGNYKALPLENNIYRTIALATVRGKTVSLASEKMIQEIRDQVKLF